jgi:hypothetical protein
MLTWFILEKTVDRGTRAEAVASKLHKVIVLASVGIVDSHLSGPALGRFIDRRIPGETQFDDLDCCDLLHAGRAGYLYCFAA